MKQDFNVNTFRFSVAWDRIEPQEGVFSDEALQHYNDEVDALLAAGITPMITLHHFAHPVWFEDKGGFEKEENIAYFVRFSKKVFEVLGHKVPLWCTINEPGIFVFQGYLPLNCVYPPGYAHGRSLFDSDAFRMGAKVLRNMMQAHTEVYRVLKSMPGGDVAQIGLVHQYLKFFSYTCWNPIEKIMGMKVNDLISQSVLDFLKTGTFSYSSYFSTLAHYEAPQGKISDFVGLNYYSRVIVEMKWTNLLALDFKNVVGPSCYKDEVMTDMPYAIYPQGLYYAIVDFSKTNLPIYITENGIADRDSNDWRRAKWIAEYLKMVSLALEDGYDVRGLYYWTLTRNFEWNTGWAQCFGVYDVNFETQERILKDGARPFAKIIKAARAGQLAKHTSDWKNPQALPLQSPALAA